MQTRGSFVALSQRTLFPEKCDIEEKYTEYRKNIELQDEGWTKIKYENLYFSRITYVLE